MPSEMIEASNPPCRPVIWIRICINERIETENAWQLLDLGCTETVHSAAATRANSFTRANSPQGNISITATLCGRFIKDTRPVRAF